jgi:hypothetical protein
MTNDQLKLLDLIERASIDKDIKIRKLIYSAELQYQKKYLRIMGIYENNKDRFEYIILDRQLIEPVPDKLGYMLKNIYEAQRYIKSDIFQIIKGANLENEYDLIYENYFEKIKQLQEEFKKNNNL